MSNPTATRAGGPPAGTEEMIFKRLPRPWRPRGVARRKGSQQHPPRTVRWLMQLGAVVFLLGTWQAVAELQLVNPAFTSEPSKFFVAFWTGLTQDNTLSLMATTLYETVIGFVVAAGMGLVVGYGLAEFKLLDIISRPFMTAFNSLPRLALAPLFVLWFGLGSASRIALIVSLSFFIVVLNTYAGLQTTSRDHLLLARVVGATRRQRFFYFVLPAALPAIFAGLQLALTYAFLGAVVGEMLSGSQGLGGYLSLKLGTFETDAFFGALLLLVIVAVILAGLMRLVELRVVSWRSAEMRGTGIGG